MRYALLIDGVVVNVVLWDGESEYAENGELVPCPDEVSVGWTLAAGQWVAPPEPEAPEIPSQDALRLAVMQNLVAGRPLTAEQAAVIVGIPT